MDNKGSVGKDNKNGRVKEDDALLTFSEKIRHVTRWGRHARVARRHKEFTL